ncbi:CU044_5270 family protein [Kitasatospora indigofera]|uniref:CU044_5270 family protein n=1 Tax=Kitasatospora indigofera TaxID=67307 RepID=UPI00363F7001
MNAKRDTDGRAELSSLLPAPAQPELTADRHQLLRGHLMNEITDAARPVPAARRYRKLGWIAMPAMVGGLALALVLGTGGNGTTPGQAAAGATQPSAVQPDSAGQSGGAKAPVLNAVPASAVELLGQAAQAAAKKPADQVKDGQFVYVKTLVSGVEYSGPDGSVATVRPLHPREIWLSVDGSKPGLLVEQGHPAAGKDGKPGRPDGGLELPPVAHPSLDAPTYRFLEKLPTDADALLKQIREASGPGKSPEHADSLAFKMIGELLMEQITPPAVRSALYQAAAKIPGVTLTPDAADAAGRHGVAVGFAVGDSRIEWIVETGGYELLGVRQVLLKDGPLGKKGDAVAPSSVEVRAVVDKAGDVPGKPGDQGRS